MDKRQIFSTTWIVVLCALLCNALWGSAFPCIKLGSAWSHIVTAGDKLLYAGLRFMIAGVMVIVLASIAGRKPVMPKNRADMLRIVKLCIFQTVLQYLFFYIGLSNTSGVKASIVEGSNVFVAIIIAAIFPVSVKGTGDYIEKSIKKEKISIRILIGCAIGFAGVVIVNLTSGGIDMKLSLNGEGFIFLSTIAYGISTVLIKRYAEQSDTVMLSGWQFFVGGVILTMIGYISGGRINVINAKGILMLIYLATVSAIAYTLWGVLLKYNSVSRIAVFGFANPVFGVIMSAVWLDENKLLDLRCVIALLFVCIGIYLVNSRRNENG